MSTITIDQLEPDIAQQLEQRAATALLDETISLFLNGEPETARLILRDLVNATIGFEVVTESVK